MTKSIAFLFSIFVLIFSGATFAEVIVVNDSISVGPVSNADFTDNVVSRFYGGIAGECAADAKTGSAVCNSCNNSSTLEACNTQSIYSTLNFSVSFKVSKDVTAIASLIFLNSSGAEQTRVDLASATYTANSNVVTIATTWQQLCSAAGAGACLSTASGVFNGQIAFGVDANADGSVSLAEETKKIPFTVHVIAPADPIATRTYCATPAAATDYGFCQMNFLEGDQKVYVDEFTLGSNTVDDVISGTSVRIDAVAIFPVPTIAGNEATVISNFRNNQVTPIYKEIDTALGISDSRVEGGLENYQKYCFIFASRSKAQNIYRFVVDPAAAGEICKSPSENVGVLADKSCFITTATYGSDKAYQVQTFRDFRNRFLLPNKLGLGLTQFYYAISPAISDVINSWYGFKILFQVLLFPLWLFSYLAVQYGLLEALLSLLIVFVVLLRMKKVMKLKYLAMVLVLFALTPAPAEAQLVPKTTTVPNTEDDGLTRITKDGVYIYEVERPLRNQSSRLMFGQAQNPEVSIDIEQVDASGNGTGAFQTFIFEDFYGTASNFIISYEYEWFPFVGKVGKLGLQGGASLMFAQGNGIQVASLAPSVEKYTFFTVPLTLGAVYRFEYKDKQWLAPFVSGGGTYVGLLEKREDRSKISATAAPGFYAAGGALINIALLDPDSSYTLEAEYGLSNLWISLEYRIIEVNSEVFGFSSSYFNAGLAFDF